MMAFEKLSDIRILYMGTPAISADVLTRLLEKGLNVVGVVTNMDKPKGRGGKLEPTPVKQVALDHDIPVYQPMVIREEYGFLKKIDFDVLLTMAYGQILPAAVLGIPEYGCYNLHGSLLPKYRGAAPMQRALFNGDPSTGVTLMEMVAKMDAGRMFAKEEFPLSEEDNYSSVSDKVAIASAKLVEEHLLEVVNKENLGVEQDEKEVTYADKVMPFEEELPLYLPCEEFVNRVRGLSFAPGGYLFLEGKKLKVFAAKKVRDGIEGEIGEIVGVRKGLFVQGTGGILRFDLVQLEGKKRMDGASFANGMHDLLGKVLENE